jgi:hypothetical protein
MNGSVEFSSVQASGVIASHPLSSRVSIHGADSNSANNFKKRGANPVTELAVPPALSPFKVADANFGQFDFETMQPDNKHPQFSFLPAPFFSV